MSMKRRCDLKQNVMCHSCFCFVQNRELQIMRKLDHCNIVRLRYFFYSSGDKVSWLSVLLFILHPLVWGFVCIIHCAWCHTAILVSTSRTLEFGHSLVEFWLKWNSTLNAEQAKGFIKCLYLNVHILLFKTQTLNSQCFYQGSDRQIFYI